MINLDIQINWLGALLSISIFQAWLTAGLLWFRKNSKSIPNRLLAGFCLALGLGLSQLIFIQNYGLKFSPIQVTFGSTPFLYGPMVYFYIRAYINREFRFQKAHFWHLLPYLLVMSVRLYRFIIYPEEIPRIIQVDFVERPPWWFVLIGLCLLIHIFTYLGISLNLVRRYRRYVRTTASFEDQMRLKWISWISLLLFSPFITALFSALIWGPIREFPLPALIATAMIFLIHALYLIQPMVLDGLAPELEIEAEEDLEPIRYESSSLSAQQKEKYSSQLLLFIETHAPYRSQNLTLKQLADQLGINSKYLSQVINELHNQNFMDFINSYRIQEAQKMLRSSRYDHYTIVAIAQEVGFRSRSAFYAAFKKVTGKTPTEFKKGE